VTGEEIVARKWEHYSVVTGTVAEVCDIAAQHKYTNVRYRAQIDGTDFKAEVCSPGLGMDAAIKALTNKFVKEFRLPFAAAHRIQNTKFFYIRYIRGVSTGRAELASSGSAAPNSGRKPVERMKDSTQRHPTTTSHRRAVDRSIVFCKTLPVAISDREEDGSD
jgi:hypothetical protein